MKLPTIILINGFIVNTRDNTVSDSNRNSQSLTVLLDNRWSTVVQKKLESLPDETTIEEAIEIITESEQYKRAITNLASNKNCVGCHNCKDCDNCRDCYNCRSCAYCRRCEHCTDCTGCTSSDRCKRSKDLRSCERVVDSSSVEYSEQISDCYDVRFSSYCKNAAAVRHSADIDSSTNIDHSKKISNSRNQAYCYLVSFSEDVKHSRDVHNSSFIELCNDVENSGSIECRQRAIYNLDDKVFNSSLDDLYFAAMSSKHQDYGDWTLGRETIPLCRKAADLFPDFGNINKTVVEHIGDQPSETFNVFSWHGNESQSSAEIDWHDCGTPHCYAGWVQWVGYQAAKDEKLKLISKLDQFESPEGFESEIPRYNDVKEYRETLVRLAICDWLIDSDGTDAGAVAFRILHVAGVPVSSARFVDYRDQGGKLLEFIKKSADLYDDGEIYDNFSRHENSAINASAYVRGGDDIVPKTLYIKDIVEHQVKFRCDD